MTNLRSIVLTTPLLVLRSVQETDADDILREATPEVTRYLTFDPSDTTEGVMDFIHHAQICALLGTECHLAIMKEKEFLGVCGIQNLQTPYPEPGLWLKQAAWGQGYGTEIVQCLLDFARTLAGAQGVHYHVAVENSPSRRIAEKMGGKVIRTDVWTITPKGRKYQKIIYEIPFA